MHITTRSDTTGFSPFLLLFGRHPRQPIDLIFQTTTLQTKQDYPQYVKMWRTAMQEAYQVAGKKINEIFMFLNINIFKNINKMYKRENHVLTNWCATFAVHKLFRKIHI